MLSRRRISAALIGLIVLVLGGWLIKDVIAAGDSSDAPGSVPGAESGLQVEPLSSLPEQADETYRLIEQDGPFPYPERDGTVFGNRERLLPEQESGYYREYTVPTPGSADRGARRLVEGEADELYYTADHYASFVVVDPSR
ncbi:ribonuclease N [Prauserella marina]|uniref:Guanyl-specific ribonuclease Sa n=1 Tax=Prauserella marina TaxID=530584 RepID=A0A222VMI0_9PSEU|nr:ribonuclease domain-containing protein [Prauserella marina]ASR35094.1 ribonuclease N [Prauserella marina]PWV85154.1 guanyl-specific ribonuclease Sa [Prauserella marina]SDC03557.1 Guanyl-specific ribonuclease Sa [Prauserella marina]